MPDLVSMVVRMDNLHSLPVFKDRLLDFNKILPIPEDIPPAEKAAWRVAHWGTDRNALHCQMLSRNTISFCAAWFLPQGILSALSKMDPKSSVDITYAGESPGELGGWIQYKNGVVTESYQADPYSNDAFDLFLECWESQDHWKYGLVEKEELDEFEK